MLLKTLQEQKSYSTSFLAVISTNVVRFSTKSMTLVASFFSALAFAFTALPLTHTIAPASGGVHIMWLQYLQSVYDTLQSFRVFRIGKVA